MSTVSLSLPRAKTLLVWMLAAIAAMIALHGFAHSTGSYTLVRTFGLSQEATVAAWLSSIGLLSVALALAMVSIRNTYDGNHAVGMYRIAALAFLFFAVDEVTGIHERIGYLLDSFGLAFMQDKKGGWMIVYAVVGIALAAICLKGALKVLKNEPTFARRFALGFAIWFLGGIVLEAVMQVNWFRGPLQSAMEEGMEMTGVAVMLWSVLEMLAESQISVAFRPARVASEVLAPAPRILITATPSIEPASGKAEVA